MAGENLRFQGGGDPLSRPLKDEGRRSHAKNYHNDGNDEHFLRKYSLPGTVLRAFHILAHLILKINLE